MKIKIEKPEELKEMRALAFLRGDTVSLPSKKYLKEKTGVETGLEELQSNLFLHELGHTKFKTGFKDSELQADLYGYALKEDSPYFLEEILGDLSELYSEEGLKVSFYYLSRAVRRVNEVLRSEGRRPIKSEKLWSSLVKSFNEGRGKKRLSRR